MSSLSVSEKELPKDNSVSLGFDMSSYIVLTKNGALITSYDDDTPICHLSFAICYVFAIRTTMLKLTVPHSLRWSSRTSTICSYITYLVVSIVIQPNI